MQKGSFFAAGGTRYGFAGGTKNTKTKCYKKPRGDAEMSLCEDTSGCYNAPPAEKRVKSKEETKQNTK
jgi:hypothetical protein